MYTLKLVLKWVYSYAVSASLNVEKMLNWTGQISVFNIYIHEYFRVIQNKEFRYKSNDLWCTESFTKQRKSILSEQNTNFCIFLSYSKYCNSQQMK